MARLIVYKTTIFDAADIRISKGQILYCADTNTYLYDLTDAIRLETDKIHYSETEEDHNNLLLIEGHIYYIREKNVLYKYSHKDLLSPIELIPVTTSEEIFDIFDAYDELAPTTLFQNGNKKKLAPATIASQVYTSDGNTVEDRLRAVTRISKVTVDVTVGEDQQKDFVIPFPFENYLDDPGNSFEVHIGSTLVSPERYVINANNILSFLEWDKGIEIGRTVTFIFWYNSSIINESAPKMVFDGHYLANGSVTHNKLAKISDDFLNSNKDTIPTCKAIRDLYDNLSKKLDMFTFGLIGRCLTREDNKEPSPNRFWAPIYNFTLLNGSYLELTLHKTLVAGSVVRVNYGQYIPIYLNNQPVTSGSLYREGNTITLKYDEYAKRLNICTFGRYIVIPESYVYTASENENIITFNLKNYVPGVHHPRVYQNNVRIFEELNYTLDGDRILLKDYTTDKDDIFYFELDNIVDA